jgi:hypothetical protein
VLFRLTYAFNKEDIFTTIIKADNMWDATQVARAYIDSDSFIGAVNTLIAMSLLEMIDTVDLNC